MIKKALLTLMGGLMLMTCSAQAGDAGAGKAKSEACVQCHGDTGKDDPPIAGKAEADFINAMKEYQSGVRKHKKMSKATTSLSDGDIADLAAYYATLK